MRINALYEAYEQGDIKLSPELDELGRAEPNHAVANKEMGGNLYYVDRDANALLDTFSRVEGRALYTSITERTADSDAAILDYGAGTGNQIVSLLEDVPHPDGANMDRLTIDAVNDVKCDHLSARWRTRLADALGIVNYEASPLSELALPADSYDMVLAFDAFAGAKGTPEEVAKVYRALKQGGAFYLNLSGARPDLQQAIAGLQNSHHAQLESYAHTYTPRRWVDGNGIPTSYKITKPAA